MKVLASLFLVAAAMAGVIAPEDNNHNHESEHDVDYDLEHDGFYVDPGLPDGNYHVTMQANGRPPLVKRWEPDHQRWKRLVPRSRTGWGSGEFTFTVDEDEGRVVDMGVDLYSESSLPVPISTTGCFHSHLYETLNYALDPDDYRHTKMAFYNWCNTYKFKKGHVELALKGSVAVYSCVRKKGEDQYCSEAEFEECERDMNATCGAAPAFTWISSWGKEYGRSWKGSKICGKFGKIHKLHNPNKFEDRKIADGSKKILNSPLPLHHRPEWKYHGAGMSENDS